jgi:ribosomal protein S18 acetylase RimI-like enzyme
VPTIWLNSFMAEICGVPMDQMFRIREYQDQDFDAATILWRVAREKLLPEGETDTGHNFYEDQHYFRDQVLKKNHVWVVEVDLYPAAFMAMQNDFIDQLYVHPRYQRCGIGKALLEFARSKSPEHLWLYTLQSNVNAQAFYEKNGFVAEKFGLSPENEPDVEYHWRKSQSSI